MDIKKLKAEKRTITGRKVKNLRKAGVLPGNVFGKKVKSLSIQLDAKDFKDTYKETGETGLITLQIDKEEKPVLVYNLQLNPKTEEMIHVDFLQVDLKEKVEAEVPVELTGESPAEKQALGTVVQQLSDIKVEALPADLPEKFEVSIENLSEVDQAIYIKDLKYDKSKVEIKDEPDAIVAKVEPPQKEEVLPEPTPVEGEVPAEGVETGAEGETPAEEGEPVGNEPQA